MVRNVTDWRQFSIVDSSELSFLQGYHESAIPQVLKKTDGEIISMSTDPKPTCELHTACLAYSLSVLASLA